MNYFIRKLEKSDIKPLSKIMIDAFLNESGMKFGMNKSALIV